MLPQLLNEPYTIAIKMYGFKFSIKRNSTKQYFKIQELCTIYIQHPLEKRPKIQKSKKSQETIT